MQSKTSSFKAGFINGTLLRKNLSRFWPLWAVYAAIWLIMMPLAQFVTLFGTSAQYYDEGRLLARAENMVLGMAGDAGLVMAVIFGCLAAMALCSYLCTARSVGMMHSFPIRRESLYATNFLSGAAIFASVNVVTFLLTAAVQAAGGVLVWKNLLLWLGCTLGTLLFFYGFAFFCAMFTGQILAIPVFYGILNVLAKGLNYLVQNFASVFFYGYSGGGTPEWVVWLTPVWKLVHALQVDNVWDATRNYSHDYYLTDPGVTAIYAAVGVAFALLGLLVYRTRKSETANDTVTVRWVKPVFCYGAAVCFALSLGQGLYFLVWQEFRGSSTYSLPAILVCMIITGLVGYYAAEMLLKKSFRVFRNSWKGAAVLCAALIVFGVGVSMDVTGVERKVPAADTVESVYVSISGQNYCSASVSDTETIEQVRVVQQALIDNKASQLVREEEDQNRDGSGYDYTYLDVNYTLKNGSSVRRSYSVYYRTEELQDASSPVARMETLMSLPTIQRANLLGGNDYTGRMTAGELGIYREDGNGGYYDSVSFDASAAEILYAAMVKDIDAGHFGQNQFDYSVWAKDAYVNSLMLYYSSGNDEMDSISVDFSANCTYLVAALKETGVVDESHSLVTYAEQDTQTIPADTVYAQEASGGIFPGDQEIVTDSAIIGGADAVTAIAVA